MYNIANNMDKDQTATKEFQYYCLLPQKVCLNNNATEVKSRPHSPDKIIVV